MKRGFAELPLHGGKAPKWLFERMIKLAREITYAIVIYFGREEFLARISDPYWFQSFGCVLGFDWHSSGVTTTVTGALKEGLKPVQAELGLFFAGGKGKRGMLTPKEIDEWGERGFIDFDKVLVLKNVSRLTAKVDSSCLQDGYSIYHHFLIYSKGDEWAVVQQGMKGEAKLARRYHWFSKGLESFVSDPHSGIASLSKEKPLNLVDSKIEKTRSDIILVSIEMPVSEIKRLREIKSLIMPMHHPIYDEDFDEARLKSVLERVRIIKPSSFTDMLLVKGLGEKSLRALTLLSHLLFGSDLSFKDPVTFSFAHGGKDGYPFPVDRKTYDNSIYILEEALRKAKLNNLDKLKALRRLSLIT